MVAKKSEILKEEARNISIKEGIFATAKGSFGDTYISPFAIAVKTSDSMIALLSSFSGLLGPLTQMFSSRLMEKTSRKEVVVKTVFFESLMWIPFIIVGYLFYKGLLVNFLPFIILLSYSVYIVIANIGGPAWFSWMGDIVDKNQRGQWFAKRNLILGFVSIILSLLAAFFLDFATKKSWLMFGFIIIFSLSLIFRMFSWKSIRNQYEPKMKIREGYYFSLWDFIKRAPKTNFGRFSIFRALFSFACSVSSPFFTVYLLRNLGLNYSLYMIITLAGSVFSLLVLEIWGKIADKYGNYVVMGLTSVLIPTVPLLWILSPSTIYLILVPSLVSGISWAGFNLSSGNFIYDNVSKQKRGLVISYFNMLNGIGVFLGAGLGALLIKLIPATTIEPIFIIFIFDTLLRMAVVFWWMPKMKEIRKVEKFHGTKAFKKMLIKEVKPTLLEEVHQIRSIGEYLRSK
jgi:MFS family permease